MSRVIGVGPQVSFFFPVAGMQGAVVAKGYREFDARDRPSGYNLWLMFSIIAGGSDALKPITAKF